MFYFLSPAVQIALEAEPAEITVSDCSRNKTLTRCDATWITESGERGEGSYSSHGSPEGSRVDGVVSRGEAANSMWRWLTFPVLMTLLAPALTYFGILAQPRKR